MSAPLRPLPLDTTRTTVRFVALVLLAVVALAVASAGSASAHPRLVHSSPATGTVLAREPHRVVLTFNETVIGTGTTVGVTDSAGRSVTDGPLATQGHRVVTPLRPGLPDGSYTISYRVVGNGHTATGAATFTLHSDAVTAADPSIS